MQSPGRGQSMLQDTGISKRSVEQYIALFLPAVYRQAVSGSGSGALELDKSASIFNRRVMSNAKSLAILANTGLPVCSITHFTAGFEQMDRNERAPATGYGEPTILLQKAAPTQNYHDTPNSSV
jgi:hypothetical protein